MRLETPSHLFAQDGFRRFLVLLRATPGPAAFSRRCPGPVLQAAMQNDILASLTRLSDAELVARLKGLVARDHDLNAQLVAHLAELDTRDVFLREGYASLFVYCRDALGLSEWEAYNRIEVARAARRFPVILAMLAEGSVNLTAVRLLALSCESSRRRIGRALRPLANLFWNKLNPRSGLSGVLAVQVRT